jgi:hypothetical protein
MEFTDLLRSAFPHVDLLAQNTVAGAAVYGQATAGAALSFGDATHPAPGLIEECDYLVAVCSTRARAIRQGLIRLDSASNLLLERWRHIQALQSELAQAQQTVSRVQREYEDRTAWAQRLDTEMEAARAQTTELERVVSERTDSAQRLAETVRERDSAILALQQQVAAKQRVPQGSGEREVLSRELLSRTSG